MIDTSLLGSNVTAGTNATAEHYNALRTDMATGWIDPEITASYTSVSGQVGVIAVPTDARTLFEIGDKVKLTQGTSTKYFYVTAVAATALSITAGALYTLEDAAISNFRLSKAVAPVDWPLPANPLVTVTDAATVTFDLDVSKIQQVTLGGNRTLALSHAKVGDILIIRLIQDGMGSRTVTWWSDINWDNNAVPTLTTTATRTDVFAFIASSSGNYDGFVLGQGIPT